MLSDLNFFENVTPRRIEVSRAWEGERQEEGNILLHGHLPILSKFVKVMLLLLSFPYILHDAVNILQLQQRY
jgi:hypothetical protein